MSTESQSSALVLMPDTEQVVTETGATAEKSVALFSPFRASFEVATKLLAEESKATSSEDARKLRLKLVKARTGMEAVKKSAKADITIAAKVIDWYFNKGTSKIEEAETRLEAIEKEAERAEAARKAALKAEREAALKPFVVSTTFYVLETMPAETFAELLNSSRIAHEAKLAEAKRIEEAMIAKEKADAEAKAAREKAEAEERERIRLENERLKREADEREAAAKIERERIAKEKADAEEALRVERETAAKEAARIKAESDAKIAEQKRTADEAEAKAKIEADAKAAKIKAEADKAAKELAEKNRIEREALEAKAKAERDAIEAKAKADREAATKLADEERAKREKLEAEVKARDDAAKAALAAEQEAQRRAALAPDKDKLLTYANAIRGLELPDFATAEAQSLATVIKSQREKFAKWLEEKAGGL